MKRVVLITGVTGGIGNATARIFADAGWHVIGVDLLKPEKILGIHHFINADISDPASSKDIFTEVADDVGRIDALVNNAAIQVCKPLVDTTLDEWEATMASNVRSVYLMVRNAYPLMQIYGGSIVNVSSVHALATSANIAAYAASKGALLALTRALAIELASDNIRVNAVLPGAVDTPMLRASLNRGHLEGEDSSNLLQQLGARHALGRIGRPEEIGHAILFLADGDKSSFITGQSLIVDGGAIAKLSTE